MAVVQDEPAAVAARPQVGCECRLAKRSQIVLGELKGGGVEFIDENGGGPRRAFTALQRGAAAERLVGR